MGGIISTVRRLMGFVGSMRLMKWAVRPVVARGTITMSITIMGIITMGIASFRARGFSRLRCLTSASQR